MPLDAGKLRHRLLILSLTSEQDSDGEMIETWAELDTVWGDFQPFSTKDVLASKTIQETLIARAVIRYHAGVSSDQRLSFRGVTYKIDGPPLPDVDSGLEYLTLMLSEIPDV